MTVPRTSFIEVTDSTEIKVVEKSVYYTRMGEGPYCPGAKEEVRRHRCLYCGVQSRTSSLGLVDLADVGALGFWWSLAVRYLARGWFQAEDLLA